MIDTVVFDMGNVLLGYDPELCIKDYTDNEDEKRLLKREVFGSEEWNKLDCGQITYDEATEIWKSRLPVRMHKKLETVIENWHLYLYEITDMTAIVKRLSAAGIGTYLLTNVSVRFDEIKKSFGFVDAVMDGYVASAENKMMKPDHRIYELLINKYRIDRSKALFVDDRAENVEAAVDVGMQGYLFDGDAKKFEDYLHSQGLVF